MWQLLLTTPPLGLTLDSTVHRDHPPPYVRRIVDPSDLSIVLEADLVLRHPPPPSDSSGSDGSMDGSDSEEEEDRAERRAKWAAAHKARVNMFV